MLMTDAFFDARTDVVDVCCCPTRAAANMMPDFLVRAGIRMMLGAMLADLDKGDHEKNVAAKMEYVRDLKTRGLAEHTQAANEQHYEVPADFYANVMGACPA